MVQKDEPQPGRRFTDTAFATVIGPKICVHGEISGEDAVDVAGTLEGDSRVAAHYRVRAGGHVMGRIAARSLVVDGTVEAPHVVADKVEIGASGRIEARVEARVVAIAEGAVFDGQLDMPGEGAGDGLTVFKERRRDGA